MKAARLFLILSVVVGAATYACAESASTAAAPAQHKMDSPSELLVRVRTAKSDTERTELSVRLAAVSITSVEDANLLLEAMQEEKLYAPSSRALSLLKYEDRHLAPAFIKGVESKDIRTKLLSIEALGKFKSKEAGPSLLKIAETTKISEKFGLGDGMLVGKALISLGDIGEERAVPVMMARLKDFGGNGEMAGVALQRIGRPAVGPLVGCSRDDSDKDKQKVCTQLLRGITGKDAAPDLLVVAKDKTNSRTVRENAVEALGYINEAKSLNALSEMFDEPINTIEERGMKLQILYAFMHTKNKMGVPLAIKILKQQDSPFRGTAVELLGEIGDKSVVPDLEGALQDTNREVRIRASRALKKITGKDYNWKNRGAK